LKEQERIAKEAQKEIDRK